MTHTRQFGAAEHWRQQLTDWALPLDLLASVEASPYGWSRRVWKQKGERGLDPDAGTLTTNLVSELAGASGSVIDIGAGSGRASLPLVQRGHPVTMVEPNENMLASLRELTATFPVEIVDGRWPEVEKEVKPHRVAMSAHVVYDVAELVPFLEAMDRTAEAGVVVEMTPNHPWSSLRDLYWEFHQLNRPAGPTTEDLAAVVIDLGREPQIERWNRPSDMVYETIDEIVEMTGRRLVLPPARWPELEERLRPRIVGALGAYQVGPLEREITTVWWRTGNSL